MIWILYWIASLILGIAFAVSFTIFDLLYFDFSSFNFGSLKHDSFLLFLSMFLWSSCSFFILNLKKNHDFINNFKKNIVTWVVLFFILILIAVILLDSFSWGVHYWQTVLEEIIDFVITSIFWIIWYLIASISLKWFFKN